MGIRLVRLAATLAKMGKQLITHLAYFTYRLKLVPHRVAICGW